MPECPLGNRCNILWTMHCSLRRAEWVQWGRCECVWTSLNWIQWGSMQTPAWVKALKCRCEPIDCGRGRVQWHITYCTVNMTKQPEGPRHHETTARLSPHEATSPLFKSIQLIKSINKTDPVWLWLKKQYVLLLIIILLIIHSSKPTSRLLCSRNSTCMLADILLRLTER